MKTAVIQIAEAETEIEIKGKKMKNYIFAALTLFSFSGCYTVLLTSEDDYSTYNENNYYTSICYGDYYYFYDNPWWGTPTYSITKTKKRDDDKNLNKLRNNDRKEGRPQFIGNPVITVPPPSRSETPNSGGSPNSSTTVEKRTENNSNSSRNNDKSDDKRNIRNNDNSSNKENRKR